jgi:hypothetical protein
MCDLLHHAKFTDGLIYNYPMFAILYGKSNCGKSRLIETIMTSMLGHFKFRLAGDLTPGKVGALQIDSVRFPVVFDDVSRERFKGAHELIKQTTDGVVAATELAPFVFSMNAEEGHAFPDEIKKRSFVIYTSATLPRNRPEADENYATVRRIQRLLGTSLYQAYLRQAFDALAHKTPTDYLAFSSSILCDLFSGATDGSLPPWCTPISHKDMQATQDEKIKETLLELWRTNPRAWNVQRDRVVLRVEPTEVHSLRKDIPGWILNEGASKGGNLVMDRGQLEHFLNLSLRRSFWSNLMAK